VVSKGQLASEARLCLAKCLLSLHAADEREAKLALPSNLQMLGQQAGVYPSRFKLAAVQEIH
jgi:hypothetical protein